MRLDLKPVTELSDGERDALEALTAAVYPPEVRATSPGRSLQWAPSTWSVLVWTVEGQLIAHVGIVTREGTLDGVPVKIGGIGGVKTHPQAQGRGYASAALRRAATALKDDHYVAFSLLVCQAHLLSFYGRLGWLPFPGRLVVEQPGGSVVFTMNRCMVLPALRQAPQEGIIDLRGLPW
jgi:aminoglycoside 2'-N-acetyltransferase I